LTAENNALTARSRFLRDPDTTFYRSLLVVFKETPHLGWLKSPVAAVLVTFFDLSFGTDQFQSSKVEAGARRPFIQLLKIR
jgi:hypothetical protein